MNEQLEQEVKLLKLKEQKRELEKEAESSGTGVAWSLFFMFLANFIWIAFLIEWIKTLHECRMSYFWGFIIFLILGFFSILIFRQEWKKAGEIENKIKATEKQIQELENPSRKLSDMSTIEQLIYYFNLRENLKDQERNKDKAIPWIISGIKTLAIFVACLAAERYLFQKEIEQFCLHNPNYRYVVDAFTLVAFWGLTSCLFGIIGYFIAKGEIKKFKKQVKQIERELMQQGMGKPRNLYKKNS